ncbi:hypothetical protein J3E69DRAFT_352700 [Trichoderma sp. SZMC 28015]
MTRWRCNYLNYPCANQTGLQFTSTMRPFSTFAQIAGVLGVCVSQSHHPHPVNESYLLVHLFHAGSTIAADRKQAAVGATQHTTGAASPGLISCSLAWTFAGDWYWACIQTWAWIKSKLSSLSCRC